MTHTLSTASIRSHFPALARIHNGHPVAYFDGPGGTQTPNIVVDAMAEYLFHHNANTHWAYPTSVETDAAIAGARLAMADFLNASTGEVAFGANMTTITFAVGRALGRGWSAGDEIVVTELDHHANVDTWRAVARERGLTVRTVPLRGRGELDLDDFGKVIGPKTRLVAVGAASNAVGTATDVTAVVRMAKAHGALTFVDGVHSSAHFLPDVRAIGCDFFVCSAYKFYGPHVGVLFTRADLLDRLDAVKIAPSPNAGPERLETGTQNHEGMAGTAAAVDFLASLGAGDTRRTRLASAFDALEKQTGALAASLLDALRTLPGVSVYGRLTGARTPTVGFTVGDFLADDVARELSIDGLFVSSGNFYAMTLIDRLGVADRGLVRVGCSCYTSKDEIDRLIRALARIAGR